MKRRVLYVIGLTAVALALSGNHITFAQLLPDDPPKVPRPISISELDGYASLLRLSEAQRHGAEVEYERYLDDFQPLRTELVDLIRRDTRVRTRGARDITHDVSLATLVNRVRTHDEALFARINESLTDEQRERMNRVRLRRERTIYFNMRLMHRLLGDNLTDLSQLIKLVDLPPDIAADIDRHLPIYEDRLTRGLRDIFHSLLRVCGKDAPPENDLQRVVDRVMEMRRINRQTYAELASLMSPDARAAFEQEFLYRAYGSTMRGAEYAVLPRLERSMNLPDLTDTQYERLSAIRQEVLDHLRSHIEKRMQIADEGVISILDGYGAGQHPDHLGRINQLNMALRQFNFELSRMLDEVLGDRRAEVQETRVRHPVPNISSHHVCRFQVTTSVYREVTERRTISLWQTDGLICSPIGADDVDDYLRLLQPDAAGKRSVRELFHDYSSALEEKLDPLRMDLQQAEFARMRLRGDDTDQADDVAARWAEIRTRINAITERADDAFFARLRETLELPADDTRLDILRRLRERQRLDLPRHWRNHRSPNNAEAVDLVQLLIGVEPLAFDWDGVSRVMAAFESDFRAARIRQRELVRAQRNDALSRRGGQHLGQAQVDDWRDRINRLQTVHQDIAEINQNAVQRLADALPADIDTELLDAFHRAAYPLVFDDPSNMESAIERAIGLPDLTNSQRDRLIDLQVSYAAELESVRSKMVDLAAAQQVRIFGLGGVWSADDVRDLEAYGIRMGGLEDLRECINRRARRTVRTILNPRQLQRIHIHARE